MVEICGMSKDQIPEYYRKRITSERCSFCTFDYEADFCEKFKNLRLRKRRQISEKITDKDFDAVIEFFTALKFDFKLPKLDSGSGKLTFEDGDKKKAKVQANFFSLILNLYISEFITDMKSTWDNGFFWEIDSGPETFEKLTSLWGSTPYLKGKSEQELKDDFESKPSVRVENRIAHLVKFSEPQILYLYTDARICTPKKCVRFTENLRNIGYLEGSKAEVRLKLCSGIHFVDNFLYCGNSYDYACYKVKAHFEGDCELTPTSRGPSQSYYFEGEYIFFYKEGRQMSRKFYLSEKERMEIVQIYNPEDENAFFWFLKLIHLKIYFFAFHLVVWGVVIGTTIKKCRKNWHEWNEREIQRQSEEERRKRELMRLLKNEDKEEERTGEARVRFK